MSKGLIIAAPASGSGKTTVTLALLRALRRAGVRVGSAKVGPDYIDPAFHAAASGRPCATLDPWAMRPETLAGQVTRAGADADLVIAEGVMGLFDGATDGSGSTADLAALTGWPVILVIDARGMAASAAALLHGFATYRAGLRPVAVIFNRVGRPGHTRLLREAVGPLGIAVLGGLPKRPALVLPERHLGLVQAGEHPNLERFLEAAADLVAAEIDLDRLQALAQPSPLADPAEGVGEAALPPLGQRIAVARDDAFAFSYPFVLEGWRAAGAEIGFFSPLANQAPDSAADAVYLPGGYPELHGGRLAEAESCLEGLRAAARRGAVVYGECGGYMVLGRLLIDAEGQSHAMAGLLPLETSFAEPALSLGYRNAVLCEPGALGGANARFRGHEFHYARVLAEAGDRPLFHCRNARGEDLGLAGVRSGSVFGSFIHLIDRAAVAGGH